MREYSQLRNDDVKTSDEVYEFLDKTFYKQNGITQFKRITDKEQQIKGVDVVFNIGNKKYYCDEKCAIRYRNLKTYSLEISFINRKNEIQDGWLVSEKEINNSFLFIWINEDTEQKTEIECALVSKEKLLKELESIGWTINKLKEKSNKIRNNSNENVGDFKKNGCKFYFSKQLVEQPINILLPKDVYMRISDLKWSVKLPSLNCEYTKKP